MEMLMRDISKNYFAAKRHIESKKEFAEEDEEVSIYHSYVERVRTAYQTLEPVEKLIINNEYFFENYPFWWTQLYSKSSFYRYKRNAMKHFLGTFNAI